MKIRPKHRPGFWSLEHWCMDRLQHRGWSPKMRRWFTTEEDSVYVEYPSGGGKWKSKYGHCSHRNFYTKKQAMKGLQSVEVQFPNETWILWGPEGQAYVIGPDREAAIKHWSTPFEPLPTPRGGDPVDVECP